MGGGVTHSNGYKPDAGTSGFRAAEIVLLFRNWIWDEKFKMYTTMHDYY